MSYSPNPMMQTLTKIGAAALSLVLLAAVAWFLFRGEQAVDMPADEVQEQADNPGKSKEEGVGRAADFGFKGDEPLSEREPMVRQTGEDRGGSFVVTCVDLANGAPLAGVELKICSLRHRAGQTGPQPGYLSSPGKPVALASHRTDSKGRAVFALPEGVTWVQVRAEKQGYHAFGQTQVFPVSNQFIVIVLYEKLILEGVVLDEQGLPVPHARLALAALATQEDGETNPYSQNLGKSDREGRFKFKVPELWFGKIRIVAWKRGYLPYSNALQLRPPQAKVSLRVILKKGSSFSFLIKDMKGNPVQGASLYLTQYDFPAQWGGHVRGHELGGQTMGIGVSNNLRSDANGMLRVKNWPTGVPAVFTILGRPQKKDIVRVSPAFPVKKPERLIPNLLLFQPETDQVYTVFLELWEGNTIVVKGKVYAPAGFDHGKFKLSLDIGGGSGARLLVKWAGDQFEVRYRYSRIYVKGGHTRFTIRASLGSRALAAFGPYDYYTDTLIQGLIVNIK